MSVKHFRAFAGDIPESCCWRRYWIMCTHTKMDCFVFWNFPWKGVPLPLLYISHYTIPTICITVHYLYCIYHTTLILLHVLHYNTLMVRITLHYPYYMYHTTLPLLHVSHHITHTICKDAYTLATSLKLLECVLHSCFSVYFVQPGYCSMSTCVSIIDYIDWIECEVHRDELSHTKVSCLKYRFLKHYKTYGPPWQHL